MNILNSPKLQTSSDRPHLFILCLLVSLGFHLLAILILPLFQQQKELQPLQQPTIIRLVDKPLTAEKPAQQKTEEYEIDQQPIKPQPDIPVESFRKANRDQKVEREQAPKGDDTRDQITTKSQQLISMVPAHTPLPIKKQPSKTVQKQPRSVKKKSLKKTPTGSSSPITTPPVQPITRPPILSLEQLLPDARILNQIANGSLAKRNRVKKRKDVEIGDTVWLNLQDDLLISFFLRFHNQVERVWNYPTEAAVNGIEGTLELLIIVDKGGELLDVDLIRTSGSDVLDFEAIQAIYRAAPFGPLTKYYPHDDLKIKAHFRYMIAGKYIYGRNTH